MKIAKLFCAAAVLSFCAGGFSQTAQEIAKAVHDRPEGKTSEFSAALTLIDKAGKTRARELGYYSMKDGDTDKTVMVFRAPKDVAGVSYLSFEYPDADGKPTPADSWLYMPAIKKAKRVSGNTRDSDFQGTDFTYDDLGNRSLAKDTFVLLGEEAVDGKDCWILERRAKDAKEKTQRRVEWIWKENYVVLKGEYYDAQDRLAKTMTAENVEKISGYWCVKKTTMKNVITSHQTVYEVKEIKYDIGVDKNLFTVNALERELVK